MSECIRKIGVTERKRWVLNKEMCQARKDKNKKNEEKVEYDDNRTEFLNSFSNLGIIG